MVIPNQALMKTCSVCGVEQPANAFYRSTLRECKACVRARAKAYRTAHPRNLIQIAHERETAARLRARIKDAVFAAYGGYVCACCGETERAFLTLDHIANDGAAFRRTHFNRRGSAGQRTYRWLLQHHVPEGFQVLCMNCNYGKRMNAGVCPHQGRSNDQAKAVGPSGPKRSGSVIRLVTDYEMVSPATKVAAAR